MKNLYLLILTLILFLAFLPGLSQKSDNNIELIFTLGSDKIRFKPGDKGIYGGVVALEYYEKGFYLAGYDKLFNLDLTGNFNNHVDFEEILDFNNNSIQDICFLDSILYVLTSKNELILIKDDRIISRYKIYFQNVTAERIKDEDPFDQSYKPEYLENVDGQLYFFNRLSFFPFRNLVSMKPETIPPRLKVDKVYVNSNMKWSISGRPLSDCEAVESIYSLKNAPNSFEIKISKYCRNTSVVKRTKLDYEGEIINLDFQSFFKNNYLKTYFTFGQALVNGKNQGMIFLDENYRLVKILLNYPYHGGEYNAFSPALQSSFTYDKNGNVYYCTNNYDREEIQNSKVEVYRIRH